MLIRPTTTAMFNPHYQPAFDALPLHRQLFVRAFRQLNSEMPGSMCPKGPFRLAHGCRVSQECPEGEQGYSLLELEPEAELARNFFISKQAMLAHGRGLTTDELHFYDSDEAACVVDEEVLSDWV